MKQPIVDIEQALQDPASAFATPEAVVAHAGLTREQKLEILRMWEYDAAEAEVATEEGMPGGNDDLLGRVLLALDSLGGGIEVGGIGPTKQHALLTRRRRGEGTKSSNVQMHCCRSRRQSTGRLLRGSVADGVARRAKVPVLLVH